MEIFLKPDLQHINIYLIVFAITAGLFLIVGMKRKKDFTKKERTSTKITYTYWFLLSLIIIEALYLFIIPAYTY